MKQIRMHTSKQESRIVKDQSIKTKLESSKKYLKWPLKVLLLTFCFSLCFSVLCETINTKVGFFVSLSIIIIFIIVNVGSDIVGVATTVCKKDEILIKTKDPKTKKVALAMINNNDKVGSFCCDIMGDICGILSGSAGAALVHKFDINLLSTKAVLLSTLISALIASITVFGKAVGKRLAIRRSSDIVCRVAKSLTFFIRRSANEKK